MSQNEFDQYLALLSGLLRLSPAQRDAIASELRDHLEERLNELLAEGVSRRQAIEMALEEFGDAAGLAGEFIQIFQQQRRRWMMRMTFGTAAAISAIALLASALWPDGRSGPVPHRAIAQDELSDETFPAPLFSPSPSVADRGAEASLQQRIDVDFLEQPFDDLLEHLAINSNLQFHVKRQQLEEVGVDMTFPVTMSLKDVPVEMVLELMLEEHGLTYVIRNGVILITTDEDSESLAEVRVYNCRDLLEAFVEPAEPAVPSSRAAVGDAAADTAPADGVKRSVPSKREPAESKAEFEKSSRHTISEDVLAQFGGSVGGFGGGSAGGFGGGSTGGFGGSSAARTLSQVPRSREDQLMDIIQIAVMPESWEDVGGPGTIGEFDGMIVIRHNPRAHRQVEQVLQMLRDASSQQSWENPTARRGQAGAGGGLGGGFF